MTTARFALRKALFRATAPLKTSEITLGSIRLCNDQKRKVLAGLERDGLVVRHTSAFGPKTYRWASRETKAPSDSQASFHEAKAAGKRARVVEALGTDRLWRQQADLIWRAGGCRTVTQRHLMDLVREGKVLTRKEGPYRYFKATEALYG